MRSVLLAFGIAAAVLTFAQFLYPLRRRLMARPFRTAEQSLQFHVYASGAAFLLALVHVGLHLPSGLIGWLLIIASGWTTFSGLAGVVLQKTLPPALAAISADQIPYERMPEAVAMLRDSAGRVADGASGAVQGWYRQALAPTLAGVRPSLSYVIGREARERSALAAFAKSRPVLSDADEPVARELDSIVQTKIRLDARASFQRLLRVWLAWHVPAAIALAALIVWHVFATLYF